MSKEVLTHSESYVKKTNRIILAVGITSFIIFIFGVVLLIKSNKVVDDYEEPVVIDEDELDEEVLREMMDEDDREGEELWKKISRRDDTHKKRK